MTDQTASTLPPHAARFAFFTVFLDAMGIGLITPVIPDLLQELSKADLGQAAIIGGYLSFIYAFMQFLAAPTLGNLSDRFGRRPVLLISLATLSIDYVIMGLAPNLVFLFIGRLIAGIAGATHSTASAFIADISSPQNRTRNFGLLGAAFGIGFVAGPIIGGLIGEYGTRAPFYAAAFLVMLNFLYGLFLLPESLPKQHRRPFSWTRANPIGAFMQAFVIPGMMLFFITFFLFNLAQYIYPSIWPYYPKEAFNWSASDIGLSLGIYGLCHAIVQAGVIRLSLKYFQESTVVMLGILINAAAMFGLLFISQGWMIYAFLPLSALGGIAAPALQGIMSRRTSKQSQGELQGALSSIMGITTIISPLIMTQLFFFFTQKETGFYNPAGPFGVASLIIVIALIPFLAALKSDRKKQTDQP